MTNLYEVRGYDRDGRQIWSATVRGSGESHAELVAGDHPLRPAKVVRLRAVAFEQTAAFRRMRAEGWIVPVKQGART